MGPGTSVSFHRGDKDGSVIATADPCKEKQGSSKVQFHEPDMTINLEHLPRRMMILPPKTSFVKDGKGYYWKGSSDLFEEKTNKLIAQYLPKMVDSADPMTGNLILTEGNDKQLDDLIVISTVVMQQRSDARKRAVCHLAFHSKSIGVRWVGRKLILV